MSLGSCAHFPSNFRLQDTDIRISPFGPTRIRSITLYVGVGLVGSTSRGRAKKDDGLELRLLVPFGLLSGQFGEDKIFFDMYR